MLSPFRLSKPILVALVLAVFQEGTRAADVPLQRRLPNHPVIVFESDDWGEVSADSAAAVRALAHEGYLPGSSLVAELPGSAHWPSIGARRRT